MINYKLILAMIILSFASIAMVGASTCFQQTANISTDCGGLNSGSYTTDGGWRDNDGYYIDEMYDGDYETGTFAEDALGNFYINYTKPINATNSSLWYMVAGAIIDNNFSIANCFFDTIQLKVNQTVVGDGFTGLYCYNGTEWEKLYQKTGVGSYPVILDEAMNWDMIDYSPTESTFDTLTQTILKLLLGILALAALAAVIVAVAFNMDTDKFDMEKTIKYIIIAFIAIILINVLISYVLSVL